MDISDDIMGAESSGDRNAKAKTSSALGPGQFIEGTWLDLIKRYRPDLALGKSRAEVLAMRTDPELSKEMTRVYEAENSAGLRRAGLPVAPGTIYLTHFAGSGGGIKLLKADPNTPVESILDAKAIAANPFLKGKTAGDVIAWADRKMATARPLKPTAGLQPAQQNLEVWPAGDARRPQPRFPQRGAPIPYLALTQDVKPKPGAAGTSPSLLPSPANSDSGGGAPMVPANSAPSAAPASFDDRFGNWPYSSRASVPAPPRTASPDAQQPSSDGGNTGFGIYKYPTDNQLAFDPGALSASLRAAAPPDARYLVRVPSPQTSAPAWSTQPGSPPQPSPLPGNAAGPTRPDLALPPPIWGFPNQSKDDKGNGDNWLLQWLGSVGVR